ncbi:MAG TPA: LysE family transporter [Chthoniobacterales bacterium]
MNVELVNGFADELIKAVTIGFCVAAPVGPCGVLCISRSLKYGFGSGVATGLGVTVADALFAAIGAFGVSAMIHLLDDWKGPLRIVGVIFLIFLGMRIALSKPDLSGTNGLVKTELHSAFVSAFLLTLANPITIFAFIGIFAGLGITKTSGPGGIWHPIALVGGIGLGSFAWWIFLSWLSRHLGKRLNPAWLARATALLGWVLAALGILGLWTLANDYFSWFPHR